MMFMLGVGSFIAALLWCGHSEKVLRWEAIGAKKIVTFLALVCGLYALGNGLYSIEPGLDFVSWIFGGGSPTELGEGKSLRVRLTVYVILFISGLWPFASIFIGFLASVIAARDLIAPKPKYKMWKRP
jgi:hypothetical protein